MLIQNPFLEFCEALDLDLSDRIRFQNIRAAHHTTETEEAEVNGDKLVKFLKEIPQKEKENPNFIHKDFGSDLVKTGINFGRHAPMGQIPKLVGKNLGILGKNYPATVKQGIDDLMHMVRGGDVWQEPDNVLDMENAQRVRFDALDIILAALNEVSANDKMPEWVGLDLARDLVEMIVLPYFYDQPMNKGWAVRMDGEYGLKPSEVAEKNSMKACETLEILLAINPDLAFEADRTVKSLEKLINSKDFRREAMHPVAVCALGCASTSISNATRLSPAAARNRLWENVRQVDCIKIRL